MNKTDIEYLDHTWNPIAMRCTPISEGCKNCWHITRAKMLAKNPMISAFAQMAYAGKVKPRLIKSRLDDPLKVKKPSRIGVQFMGDLFHDDVTDKQIDSIFQYMANDSFAPLGQWNASPHTFLLLTKRPGRILTGHPEHFERWKNIWLGVSVELQKHEQRIIDLLHIPAAVRFVSVEPMLGPVSLELLSYLRHSKGYQSPMEYYGPDWIIAGPETGPGARECKPEWIEDLYEQCKAAGVPFFDKRKNPLAQEFPK